MKRIANAPRANWRDALSEYPYGEAAVAAATEWDETVRYEFSADEIDTIEAAADEVHGLINDAVRHVIDGRLLGLVGFSTDSARMVGESFKTYWNSGSPEERHGGLFGRLDFAYDGRDPPKLVGACYDGPSGLFAASIVQWNWLESQFPDADQFNGLHEGLVERWGSFAVGVRGRNQVHLTCATPNPKTEGELAYLAATADEAGLETVTLGVQDIGWDGRQFLDLDNHKINWLAKLYPWEAMMEEQFGGFLHKSGILIQDPLWRMPASNHALLATLWELYPEHPNLCRASLSETDLAGAPSILRRSFYGLERPAEQITDGGRVVADTGAAANPGGYVYLARPRTFSQAGRQVLLNAWVVGDKCLGMTVRESTDPIGWADAAMVPHVFK